jgi:DNA-binding transcriptional LysR family regulator
VNAIAYKTMSYKGHLTGRLSIATESTGIYVMPYFLTEFIKKNEGVELAMDVSNSSKVLNSLRNNEIDFALVSTLPDDLKINDEILLENELVMVSNKHDKRNKKSISKTDINQMPLLFREEGSGTRLVMEQYFKKHKMKVRKKIELTSNEAIKQAVIVGLGYSVMPLVGIKNELLNGDLKLIPATGFPIKSKWRLIWLKKKKLSPVAEAYLNYLKSNKEQLVKEHFLWMDKIHV